MGVKVEKRAKPTIINFDDYEFSVDWDDELNSLNFIMSDGNVLDFDETKGVYPIINEDGNVFRYLDLMGRITERPLASSKAFADYLDDMLYVPYHETYEYKVEHTAVSNIPTKFFTDKEFVEAVKAEEKRRFDYMINFHFFTNKLQALIYKIHCKKQLNLKIKKAKRLREDRVREIASRIIIDRSI